jgi:hypothetical protein
MARLSFSGGKNARFPAHSCHQFFYVATYWCVIATVVVAGN